jgi:hypothetical protein
LCFFTDAEKANDDYLIDKDVIDELVENALEGASQNYSVQNGTTEDGTTDDPVPGSSKDATGSADSAKDVAIEEAGQAVAAVEVAGQADRSSSSVEGNWLSYADLMTDSYPAKSKVVYLKAFKLFERFLKGRNQWKSNVAPTELQVLNYFHYLRNELKWAPTTLWSTYARINAVMKRVYGKSLNDFKRVGDVLKSYDSGHTVKQAGIFTPQQIEDFVTDPGLSSKYWLVRKVVCLVGYFGGFRNIELKSLLFENCECDSAGYWFKFSRSKQRGRLEQTSICVPRRQPDWTPVSSDSTRVGLDFDPASLLDLYLAEIEADLQCSRDELKGDFIRATHGLKGQKFTKLPLGKNTIGRVGVQVATELCLPRPECFTGHCWRRSCGTSASDSGVNVTTLMTMMGWSNPKTAMVYVKKSRMTSLTMSYYLANVQRQNCSNPFPRGPLESRLAVKQSQEPRVVKVSKTEVGSGSLVRSEVKLEEEVDLATQDLLRDLEAEEKGESEVFNGEGGLDEVGTVALYANQSSSSNDVSVSNLKEESQKLDSESAGLPQLSLVDPRLSGFLSNLQNSGNITFNFHFDGGKK